MKTPLHFASGHWNWQGRWLVVLMQAKDIVAIGLLLSTGLLLFGIIGGVGIPGLVLFGLRWRQLRQPVAMRRVVMLAALSLLHEVLWAWTFFQDTIRPHYGGPDSSDMNLPHYAALYWAGALLCAGQLVVLATQSVYFRRARGAKRQLLRSALWAIALLAVERVAQLLLREQVPPLPDIPFDNHMLYQAHLSVLFLVEILLLYFATWRLGPGIFGEASASPEAARWHGLRQGWLLALLLYHAYSLWGIWRLSSFVLYGPTALQ